MTYYLNQTSVRKGFKALMALLYILAGLNHFANPKLYLTLMPPYIPYPEACVWLSGWAEILLGSLLCWPQVSRWAAWGIILLLIAIFPANVHMALHPEIFPTIPLWLRWLRLPLQGLLIAWAYSYTKPQPAPFEVQ